MRSTVLFALCAIVFCSSFCSASVDSVELFSSDDIHSHHRLSDEILSIITEPIVNKISDELQLEQQLQLEGAHGCKNCNKCTQNRMTKSA